MKCFLLNFYLLICLGIHATAYSVHYISINRLGVYALLKSATCFLFIIGCMVSMVIITRTYKMAALGNNEALWFFKSHNRLYSALLSANTLLGSIALASILVR